MKKKIIENLNANLSQLNAALLNAAEIVTNQYSHSSSDATLEEPPQTSSEEVSEECADRINLSEYGRTDTKLI